MCSVKKVFLEISQNLQENTSARVSFFIKKETLAQVFSWEFCENSNNTFFTEHPMVTASFRVIASEHVESYSLTTEHDISPLWQYL